MRLESNYLTSLFNYKPQAFKRVSFLVISFFLSILVFADVVITLPANCGNVCAESAADGSSPSWTNMDNIVVIEQSADDFPKNKTNATIVVSAPTGWSFNTGIGSINVDASGDITAASLNVTSSTITITWTTPNPQGDNDIDILTISGIQIRPNNTTSSGGNATCTSISDAVTGIVSSTVFANIGIIDAPSITSDPVNSTISAGQNTFFSIVANNTPTVYSWEYSDDSGSSWNLISNGGVYSNSNTATLNINGATSGMNMYLYLGNATNTCGTSSYSNNASLNVTDVCSSAVLISGCGVSNSVTAITATSGSWDPVSTSCGYSTPGGEKIYSFTPLTTGTYSIVVSSTDGSYLDYFYQEGSCSSTGWNCVGDISSAGTYGSFSFTAGNTYYILLDDENITSSQHAFYISCPIIPPSNEICANASPLPCGTTDLVGTTNGTSSQIHGSGCSIGNYGVWYAFTGDGAETTISSTAVFDQKMSVCSGTCASLSNIACIDNNFSPGEETYTFTPSLGVDYYIYVSHYDSSSTTTGDFTISRSACATNMSFNSCTSTQNNTSDISIGSVNQEIIGIEIVMDGALNPVDLTNIKVRTDDSDSWSTDISSVNIWYTGANSNFTTSSLFGTTQSASAPGNDISFSGTQQLQPGTNYFWLTYDIISSATAGNDVDASLQSVVIDGNTQVPSVLNPGSGRHLLEGCYYTLLLEDSDFDGWEGGTISVQVDGSNVLINETCTGASSSFSFVAETNSVITTSYSAGTNSVENSYLITNPNGAYVLSSGESATTPVNEAATADCEAVKTFTMNGDSYHYDDAGFIITEDINSQSGSIWSNYKIDLTDNFTLKFDIYLGDNNGGADGSAFVLQGSCTSAGGSGSSLGYGGINNSLIVEFDTYDNGSNSDPFNDHISIMKNGGTDHASDNLAGPYDSGGNIADDTWHSVEIDWVASSTQFLVKWDGSSILSYTGDIVTDLFAGDSQVFWGFTGGTGALTNLQKVLITEYPSNSTELSDATIDLGDSVNPEASTGATSYTWLPDNGSISDPNVYNPTLTPTATTEYTCLIEDGCGNVVTNKFTITVDNPLPIELLSFNAFCDNGVSTISWSTVSETNNDYFILERSTDFSNWISIARIVGAGNSNSLNNYKYVDNQTINSVKYYRLIQIDYDGDMETFDVKSLECTSIKDIYVYPNPFANEIYISGLCSTYKEFTVYIFDQTGRCLVERFENNFMNDSYAINLSELAPGVYNLQIQVGAEMFYYRIIKK